MEEVSIPWKTIKDTWNYSLPKKKKKFLEDAIMQLPEKWQKVKEQNDEYLFNEVHGENENCVF